MNDNMVNEQIKCPNVTVILSDGVSRGTMRTYEAIALARSQDLDLVEVQSAHNGECPVCKIMDYGKILYDRKKKNRKSHAHNRELKEIHVSFNIAQHDLDIKHKKVKELLENHHSVKYVLELKGRQQNMKKEAQKIVEKNVEQFSTIAKHDGVKASDKIITVLLQPI